MPRRPAQRPAQRLARGAAGGALRGRPRGALRDLAGSALRSAVLAAVRGAVAGAAGTTALHAATYSDMAVRGRPPSRTPQETVERMAAARHLDIPGEGEQRENRLTGLGSVSGIATGVGVGVGYGLLDVLRLRPRGPGGALLAGGGAMALSNATMARYHVTDPRTWTAEDWLSDLLPHAAYGLVVAAAYSSAGR